MIAPRGMYIRNIAYIPPNHQDIRNADMIELGDIWRTRFYHGTEFY
ncbi:hypothetical protein BCF55_1415 [Hydrogenivirga caldilitoris]|uniref:Uncharacterized protein n=1 Tax=Hydrogenivirga caldilitoris TaxID=246264 RepID=A0A497XSJ1_9AQUI|nr:hypothetical protein BCF55_1415 [Hydrogenivirga caldilitoris]